MMRKIFISLIAIITVLTACVPLPDDPNDAAPGSTGMPAEPTLAVTLEPTPTPSPPPTAEARVMQAEWLLFIGDYEAAAAEFQQAFDSTSDDETRSAALTGLGQAYHLSGNCGKAEPVLDRVAQEYNATAAFPRAMFFRAECRLSNGDPSIAADALAAAVAARPTPIDSYLNERLGSALMDAGRFSEAANAYAAALGSYPYGDPSYLSLLSGQAIAATGDHINAVRTFMAVYEASSNEYIRAQANYLAGRSYLALGIPEQAYARFQDSVLNYQRSYYAYAGLVDLVDAGVPVDDLNRGIVDYYAGQYALAFDALSRYLNNNSQHDGSAHYFLALSEAALGNFEAAISQLDLLIQDHPDNRFFAAAFDEKAWIQWVNLKRYREAAQTLLDFVPGAPEAPEYLYEAGRIYERDLALNEAAATWLRLINEYPSAELSYTGLLMAGVAYYRLGDYSQAQTVFQRALVLGIDPGDQAAANLWIGKCQQALGDPSAARDTWLQAASLDPTGYYSERAKELIDGLPPFSISTPLDLTMDLEGERPSAEAWLRATFAIPADANLESPGELANDPRLQRAEAFWALGEYNRASGELEDLRAALAQDAAGLFRLLDYAVERGMFRTATFASRQILTLAGLRDTETFTAPPYFNHIRFGIHFADLIEPAEADYGFSPIFLYSVIRQESMFEGFAQSSAGAGGLMQIMPATGRDIASWGFPPNYRDEDRFRPVINARMGAAYLARQRDVLGGSLYVTLAAYNGGPGNAAAWQALSQDDPDLFLEVVRIAETRNYIRLIYENYKIYERLYGVRAE